MTDYNDMTVKQLKKLANKHDIEGRSTMTKPELLGALNALNPADDLTDLVESPGVEVLGHHIDGDVVKELKRRKSSSNKRDDTGMVVRAGKNLSGNRPFNVKLYYLDPKFGHLDETPVSYQEALVELPPQVQLILKFMRDQQITSPEVAKQGRTIVDDAKKARALATNSPSANLFAYYVKLMKPMGLTEA